MSQPGNWREVALPRNYCNGWAIWTRRREIECRDAADVSEKIHGWLPQSAVLIGVPGSASFVHPICVSQFNRTVRNSIVRNTILIVSAWGLGATSFLLFGAIYQSVNLAAIGTLCLLLALVTIADYRKYLCSEEWITERALFFYWFYSSPLVRRGFVIWLTAGILIGLTQLLAQSIHGGMEGAFNAYGMMYGKVRAGEWWRLLSGPYLHYSITHYSVNLAMLLLAGTLAWGLLGSSSASVFILGNTFGVYGQMTWGGTLYDNCGGISAGVFALIAYVISSALVDRKLLPNGFVMQLVVILFASGTFSELFSISSATTGHVAGTIAGLACGLLGLPRFRRTAEQKGTD